MPVGTSRLDFAVCKMSIFKNHICPDLVTKTQHEWTIDSLTTVPSRRTLKAHITHVGFIPDNYQVTEIPQVRLKL